MNPRMFMVLTPAEQEVMKSYADRERWIAECALLGATPEQIAVYEASAQAWAPTTLYPNERIVAEARKAAREVLLRGKPMPTNAEQTVKEMWARELAGLLGI